MTGHPLASIMITLAALIALINVRFFKLQLTISIMMGSILLSLLLLLLEHTGLAPLSLHAQEYILHIHFRAILLNGMLSFLLFAGAFTINLGELKKQAWAVGILSSVSTVVSALLIGFMLYELLLLFHLNMPLIYCFLFGALISPTDPIAVLSTFKELGAPKALEACVAGESLFNDGVGIVIFVTIFELAFSHSHVTASGVLLLFFRQALGGLLYGFALGWLSFQCMQFGHFGRKVTILLTLAIVTGGYSLALSLDISGALAMVVAGFYIGHQLRLGAFPEGTKQVLTVFWDVMDEILNAILFLLIGFEILMIHVSGHMWWCVVLVVPLVLFVRLITVAVPMRYFGFNKAAAPYTISLLTWGGLRGGLAVALALSLPPSEYRDFILAMTYSVVAFAVIVQGLSIKPLVKLAKDAES